jgi:CubicO group peptidase (beta-lactamase class C family)
MQPRSVTLLVLLAILLGLIASGQATTLAAPAPGYGPLLRLAEPLGTVVADLEDYIPERMRQDDIPGLSIALIRDGEIVWTEGFGFANALSGEPVTPETVFEVGSISKAIAAYTALRLVEEGKLSLDARLSDQLSEPWLPPSEYRDQITLRHLASHSSGLRDNGDSLIGLDKSIAFRPGSSFSYSGVGMMYMQEAIEQVGGRSLEDAARGAVFEPLGMASSSFVNSVAVKPHLASGYMDLNLALMLFLIPFVPLFAVASLLGIAGSRILRGRWLPAWKVWLAAAAVAWILSLALLGLQWAAPLPNFMLLMALSAVVLALAFTAIFLAGRLIITRLSRGRWRGVLQVIWAVISIIVVLMLLGMITVPVPRVLSPQPSGVGTLRASAPDLGAFLLELADPQYLSEEMAAQIRTPQASAGGDMSWALGLGIAHAAEGDALWQNGQTFGFRNLIVIYPEHGMGVVVLSNSDHGFPVVFDVAQRALGGSAIPSMGTWFGF